MKKTKVTLHFLWHKDAFNDQLEVTTMDWSKSNLFNGEYTHIGETEIEVDVPDFDITEQLLDKAKIEALEEKKQSYLDSAKQVDEQLDALLYPVRGES